MAVDNPHDRLFRQTFSQPEVVASLIESLFPPDLAAAIDPASLRLTNDSYIDGELAEHLADLVYDCSATDAAGQSAPFLLALLLEHKSYREPNPHLQLLCYMLNRWQQDVDHKRKLTPVLPVIIYHGVGQWQYESLEQQMVGMIEPLRRHLPDFSYLLIDLSALPDERFLLFRSHFLALSAFMLKHSRNKRFEELVRQNIGGLLEAFGDQELMNAIQPVLIYLVEVTKLRGYELITIFRSGSTKNKIVMNGYEIIKAEGRVEGLQQGLQQGVEQGLQTATLKFIEGLLKIGMDAAAIALVADMPVSAIEDYIARINRGDLN